MNIFMILLIIRSILFYQLDSFFLNYILDTVCNLKINLNCIFVFVFTRYYILDTRYCFSIRYPCDKSNPSIVFDLLQMVHLLTNRLPFGS